VTNTGHQNEEKQMSDLEIDFEELLNTWSVDGFKTNWANKVELIKLEYNFKNEAEVIRMFKQWVSDRAAGLHD
jgi:ribosome-associated toxin RatA of RatAB toxin-antitoxin module